MEGKKYLGIDWGEKRIGLALADEETSLALPFKTVATLNEVLAVIKEEEIDEIIIGSPKKMSGEVANNPLWLNFVENLKEKSGKPVFFLDERLSSLAADALGGEKKEVAKRDEIAATIILQDYLDSNY
ncbi:Holliday junction resolvase RuvX [Candidatus Falkowbacteria bacterium]|jgi:putative Holliday junction resolvase|nr:Holliday junction resolvase RuvX [Candidatus Falkowbacteria bacterium]